MVTAEASSIVQDCIASGVVLTASDDNRISIKGNKQAPALVLLRSLVVQDRAAVVAAIIGAASNTRRADLSAQDDTLSKVDILPTMTLVFEPGSVLYGPSGCSPDEYRAWLWERMNDDVDVLTDLYELCNLYIKKDSKIIIEHPHATVVDAAVNYLISEVSP